MRAYGTGQFGRPDIRADLSQQGLSSRDGLLKRRVAGDRLPASVRPGPHELSAVHNFDQEEMRLSREDGLFREPVALVDAAFRAATALGLRRRAIRPTGLLIRWRNGHTV